MASVDIMMPIVDRYELTEDIRDFYDIPVILLTSKDKIEYKKKGFVSGTDNYLVKPCEPKELLFRMKALFRSYEKNTVDVIQFGQTVISKKNYEITNAEASSILQLNDFALLFLLASYTDPVFC